jgi:N-acylneuraminate cytidylyltransferase
MIYYTLDVAKQTAELGDEICVSTDDQEIIDVVENYGLAVPFVRPAELATDTASSQQVIEHAIKWYAERGKTFDIIVLLQVTSPLRKDQDVNDALALWSCSIDMVVSVKETDSNPYYVLFEEDEKGFLKKSKEGNFTRRQDCPKVYEYNGAIYLINADAFKERGFQGLQRIVKYVMTKEESLDIDDEVDFYLAQFMLEKNGFRI